MGGFLRRGVRRLWLIGGRGVGAWTLSMLRDLRGLRMLLRYVSALLSLLWGGGMWGLRLT